MTEAEWLASVDDPISLLRHVCLPKHERKLVLLVCACWKLAWHLLTPADHATIRNVEDATDTVPSGQYTWRSVLDELELKLYESVWEDTGEFRNQWTTDTAILAAVLLPGGNALNFWDWGVMELEADRAARKAAESGEKVSKAWALTRERQCQVFREIFGNPFHPTPTINPAWLTWNDSLIPQMAQHIYEQRKFTDLPILSDALIDAGCTDQDIIDHCRARSPHVRGCWVVDLILAKS